MATFRQRKGKWQVQIRRQGSPSLTRTFQQRADALRWARQTEVVAAASKQKMELRKVRDSVKKLMNILINAGESHSIGRISDLYLPKSFKQPSIVYSLLEMKHTRAALATAMRRPRQSDAIVWIPGRTEMSVVVMTRRFLGIATVAACVLCAENAVAECLPLHLLNSVRMESVADGKRLLVPALINGTQKSFILDTGGSITQIAPTTAKELGLRVRETTLVLFDLYGHSSASEAQVQSFQLGNQKAENLALRISASPEFDNGAAGLLSTDFFLAYDIDLDFAAGRLNYFSQDHCPGRVAYWPERPLSTVTVSLADGHINVPVKVDGQDLTAIIDTGATQTLMTTTVAAKAFGLVPGGTDLTEVGASQSDPKLKFYSHHFSTLTFEGLTVTNPVIGIMSERTGTGKTAVKSAIRGVLADPNNHQTMGKLVIGMNILKRLHLYIAYGEKKLYISPAGQGESVLFKPNGLQ